MNKTIKLFHKTKKAERLTNGKEVQPIKTWCGQQDLNLHEKLLIRSLVVFRIQKQLKICLILRLPFLFYPCFKLKNHPL